jgi:hypothetical protein
VPDSGPAVISTASALIGSLLCPSVLARSFLLLIVSLKGTSIFCSIACKWDSLTPRTSKDDSRVSKPCMNIIKMMKTNKRKMKNAFVGRELIEH